MVGSKRLYKGAVFEPQTPKRTNQKANTKHTPNTNQKYNSHVIESITTRKVILYSYRKYYARIHRRYIKQSANIYKLDH